MPFFKLAYLPPNTEELISHYTAVRLRLTGVGNLQMRMHSLDDVITNDLLALPMVTATNREPTRIMNFMQQRAALSGRTELINEYIRINRIVIFTKPTYNDYPGTE